MSKIFKSILLVFFIVMILVITLSLTITKTINKEINNYDSIIGCQVITPSNDTVYIVDGSILKNTYTLSDGKEYNSKFIRTLKIINKSKKK